MIKRLTFLLVTIIALFSAKKGWAYYNKYNDAMRIKVGVEGISFPKLNLSTITDTLVNVSLGVKNYSSSSYILEQVSMNIYSNDGLLIAEQKDPLSDEYMIRANDNNILPISFLLNKENTHKMVKQAGGTIAVAINRTTTGSYGIPVRVKGFIKADGITVDIDQSMTI
jgi:hypothetical protein